MDFGSQPIFLFFLANIPVSISPTAIRFVSGFPVFHLSRFMNLDWIYLPPRKDGCVFSFYILSISLPLGWVGFVFMGHIVFLPLVEIMVVFSFFPISLRDCALFFLYFLLASPGIYWTRCAKTYFSGCLYISFIY